eukprot:s992_g15.t2
MWPCHAGPLANDQRIARLSGELPLPCEEQIIDVETVDAQQDKMKGKSTEATEGFQSELESGLKDLASKSEEPALDKPCMPDMPESEKPQSDGGDSHATKFHMDLEHWVTEVSEELLGQMIHTIFGPLSVPVLLLLYGGKVGLENRSFWPFSSSAMLGNIIWAFLMTGIVANFFSPAGVMLIEQKNLPIATKYAYTSSQTWDSFNRKPIDAKYRAYMNMLIGWYMIPEENFVLQAEVAFVGVIGSHAQRSEVRVKFLPWPRNEKDLLAMRKRVDVSSKTMFFAPTGEVLRPKSCRRKAARRRIMGRDTTLPECEMQSLYDGMSSLKNKSERSLGKIRPLPAQQPSPVGLAALPSELCPLGSSFVGGKEQKLDDATGSTGYAQEDDEKILFKTAAAGGEVPIEDLFLYFLRAVQKSERAMCPPIVKLNLILVLPTLLVPSFLRLKNTGYFLGPDPVAVLAVVGLWPSNFVCLLSSLCFIAVGALDMWRRRALMRSCAAMLSVQREFRRHCPAEVDMLPVLDFSDVKTIAGWRKLRQLCGEWGKFYHHRIRAFSAEFFAFLLIILADLMVGMLVPEYTELSGVNLSSLLVAGMVSTALIVSILLLVYLGNEVNEAAERHRFILNRTRCLLIAMKHDDESRQNTTLACSKEKLEKSTDMMASLSDELESESKVMPLTLLGMPLGYSLLSFLNFIPIGVVSTLVNFCGNKDNVSRCTS